MRRPTRILHVEDDEDIATIVRLSLQLSDQIEIDVARSAPDALAFLRTTGQEPDIVLLDVQLGADSGLELLEQIRRMKPLLPVVLMTASVTDEQRRSYRDAGASGLIPKPFDPLQLADKIAAFRRD